MKYLTLKYVWFMCISMWTWIVSEWNNLEEKPRDIEHWANRQKEKWIKENHPDHKIVCNCYFCEYAEQHRTIEKDDCVDDKLCPGTKVDTKFDCYEAGWASDPPRFLAELKRLNPYKKKMRTRDKKQEQQ